MARKQNFQTVSWFWDLHNRKLLDLDPPYQRRSVWNQSFKDYFIDTILVQYPSPAIFLFEEMSPDGRAMYHVVDGKQRLTTIFEFIRNRFPVYEKAVVAATRGKYFEQLDDETKTQFWRYQFLVEYLETSDENVINNIFDRINRNTARLTAQELRHAQFDGEFITVAENQASWLETELGPKFPYIATVSRRQMKDVELVALLLLLVEEGPKGYSTLLLDKAFADRDMEWEQSADVQERFCRAIQVIKQIVNDTELGPALLNSRLKNQTDFYSLFGAIDQLLVEGVNPELEAWVQRLQLFIDIVDDENLRMLDDNKPAASYYEAARSASNDVGPRRMRIIIVKQVLMGQVELRSEPEDDCA